jgi:glucose/arabinose dehydrogenase
MGLPGAVGLPGAGGGAGAGGRAGAWGRAGAPGPYPRWVGRRVRAVAAMLGVVLTVTTACSFGAPKPDQAGEPPRFPTPSASTDDGGGEQEVVATVLAKGLEAPWGLAFLPDGSALVTERDTARILQVGPGTRDDGLTVTEIQTVAEVEPGGEGGLLGIAVSPQYKTDKTVYVYYSTAKDNRVAKLVRAGKPTPILTGIPRSATHDGGRVEFGPDGFLYVTTGDATPRGQVTDPKSLAGKILRMTVAGKPAPGNPGKNSLIWSSGHRDVQGIAWDASKRMYATESGQDTVDELNLIEKGRNYGWPTVEGATTDKKLMNPLVTWPTAESSCAGAAVLEKIVATACLTGERLWLVETTASGTVFGQPHAMLVGEYGRLRTVVAAPDGSLWVTTSNRDGRGEPTADDDRIIRLVFSGDGAGRS